MATRRLTLSILCLAACSFVGSACLAQVAGFGLSETVEPTESDVVGERPETVDEIIASMDLRARISQLMFVKLEGLHGPSAADRRLLSDYAPGGVVLPALVDHRAAAEYVTYLRTLPIETEKRVPLFIAASLRNNTEMPLKTHAFRNLPSQMSIAAAHDGVITRAYGSVLAEHLVDIGLNTFLGPSLELAPNLPGALPSVEVFGDTPDRVGEVGLAYIKAIEGAGLLVMPTGFPGGGLNRLRKGPAILLTPEVRLAEHDLAPYAQAIDKDASMLHVANTLVRTGQGQVYPASLSAHVIRGWARGQLGFDGLIMAGPVDRWDVTDRRTASEAAIEALHAGADLLYWSEGGLGAMRAVEQILASVNEGRLSEAGINAALRRALELKRGHELLDRPLPKIRDSKKRKEDQRLADEILHLTRHSVTLVKNTGGLLPLSGKTSPPLGITGTVGVEALHDALEEHIKPIVQQEIKTARHLGSIQDFEIMRVTSRVKGIRTAICVFENTLKTTGKVKLIRELKRKGARVVVVLTGYPGNISVFGEADAIVAVFADPTDEMMKAIAEMLMGRGPLRLAVPSGRLETVAGKTESLDVRNFAIAPSGRLPVSIDKDFPAGHFVPSDPVDSIKTALWEFSGGKKLKGLQVEYAFETPGVHTFTLHIKNIADEEISKTYEVTVK